MITSSLLIGCSFVIRLFDFIVSLGQAGYHVKFVEQKEQKTKKAKTNNIELYNLLSFANLCHSLFWTSHLLSFARFAVALIDSLSCYRRLCFSLFDMGVTGFLGKRESQSEGKQ